MNTPATLSVTLEDGTVAPGQPFWAMDLREHRLGRFICEGVVEQNPSGYLLLSGLRVFSPSECWADYRTAVAHYRRHLEYLAGIHRDSLEQIQSQLAILPPLGAEGGG